MWGRFVVQDAIMYYFESKQVDRSAPVTSKGALPLEEATYRDVDVAEITAQVSLSTFSFIVMFIFSIPFRKSKFLPKSSYLRSLPLESMCISSLKPRKRGHFGVMPSGTFNLGSVGTLAFFPLMLMSHPRVLTWTNPSSLGCPHVCPTDSTPLRERA